MNERERRLAAIQRQQALIDAARNANRSLSDTEQAEFDSLTRQIAEIDAKIAEGQRQQTAPAAPAAAPETPAMTDEQRQAVADAERTRISEINAMARDFNMDLQQYIDGRNTVEEVRAAVLQNLRANHAPIPAGSIQTSATGEDNFRRDISDALAMRGGVNIEHPSDGSRRLVGMSLRDLAIECMIREGKNANEMLRKSNDELYTEMSRQFYNPTAAFPAILDQTIEKRIVQLYSEVETTFEEFTTSGSVKDFKPTPDHQYVIGGVGDFVLVPEGGELKMDTPRTELLPNRQVKTYGKSFSMTREAFINDDIGFLTEVPGLYSKAAKRTIDKQVYKLLFENSTIFDNKALFCADHGNLISSGTRPTQASIQAMILKMQMQKDQFGEPIYVTPQAIIVPLGYGFDLDVIFHSAQVPGSNNNDYNPLYNKRMRVVESPVLNALAGNNACPWFMTATPSSARGIQVDYLNGQKTPTFRRGEKTGQLGFVWDMWLDWGVCVRDYRGIVKNNGVAIS